MNPTDDVVLQAFNGAPKIIQESLSEGKAVDFMEAMFSRYDLHVDTVGYVMVFIRNMLLGLVKPDEFIGKLNSVGISDELARRMTADLNAEVFVPLRDDIRKSGGVVHAIKPTAPAPPSSSVMPKEVPIAAQPSPALTTPVETKAPEPEPIASPPAPVIPPAVPMPAAPVVQETSPAPDVPPEPSVFMRAAAELSKAQEPIEDVMTASSLYVPPVQPVPSAPAPTMRTMQHDMDSLQHGIAAVPFQSPTVIPSTPPAHQMTPARGFQTASVPYTSIPTPSRPVEEVTVVPAAPLPPQPVTPPAPAIHEVQPQISAAPASLNPASDPYREAI